MIIGVRLVFANTTLTRLSTWSAIIAGMVNHDTLSMRYMCNMKCYPEYQHIVIVYKYVGKSKMFKISYGFMRWMRCTKELVSDIISSNRLPSWLSRNLQSTSTYINRSFQFRSVIGYGLCFRDYDYSNTRLHLIAKVVKTAQSSV